MVSSSFELKEKQKYDFLTFIEHVIQLDLNILTFLKIKIITFIYLITKFIKKKTVKLLKKIQNVI